MNCLRILQGDPSAWGLGYVDISSISYRCYPEIKLKTNQHYWPSRIGHLAEEKEDPRCKQVALKICKMALASNIEARVVADPK